MPKLVIVSLTDWDTTANRSLSLSRSLSLLAISSNPFFPPPISFQGSPSCSGQLKGRYYHRILLSSSGHFAFLFSPRSYLWGWRPLTRAFSLWPTAATGTQICDPLTRSTISGELGGPFKLDSRYGHSSDHSSVSLLDCIILQSISNQAVAFDLVRLWKISLRRDIALGTLRDDLSLSLDIFRPTLFHKFMRM